MQEIFDINSHVPGGRQGYADDGYAVVGPALFDRVEPTWIRDIKLRM